MDKPVLFHNYLFITIYLLIIIFSIKCTFLLALLTIDRWAILLFTICTPLAFVPNEGSNYVTIFTSTWATILFYVLFTFFTYGACTIFSEI